jgi:hypothetical protein
MVAGLSHLPKIGFDYRVRRDSLRVKAGPHAQEIVDYIFNKPEMTCYKLLREMDEEVQNLRGGIRTIQNSPSYRLGHSLLAPARLLRKLWRRFCWEMRCFQAQRVLMQGRFGR